MDKYENLRQIGYDKTMSLQEFGHRLFTPGWDDMRVRVMLRTADNVRARSILLG